METANNKPNEGVYSVASLSAAARQRFNAPPELVEAALKEAGRTEATFTEARAIVQNFMNREVL